MAYRILVDFYFSQFYRRQFIWYKMCQRNKRNKQNHGVMYIYADIEEDAFASVKHYFKRYSTLMENQTMWNDTDDGKYAQMLTHTEKGTKCKRCSE